MKICLTIGVSKSEPLANLPGAILAANEMGEWARRSGFETEIVTDENTNNPVTILRIREALLRLLPSNDEVELFILHFAGHGFSTGAEQHVWLPSDWNSEKRGVLVDGLKNRLYQHGIKSLTIISDACRSLPTSINISQITPDSVLPNGPYSPKPPVIDRFNAVLDGNTAIMLPADSESPARCVFSSVLIEGLYGLHEEAFSNYKKDYILPESLARYSQESLKTLSQTYGKDFTPDISLGSPIEHTYYLHRNHKLSGIKPPKWPSIPKQIVTAPTPNVLTQHETPPEIAFSRSVLATKLTRIRRKTDDGFKMLSYQQPKSPETNLLILGQTPKNIWTTSDRSPTNLDKVINEFEFRLHVKSGGSTQVLIEFPDEKFASAVIYDDLVTVVYPTANKDGFNVTFNEVGYPSNNLFKKSVNLIFDLQSGRLTASMADRIAADLREQKHSNPTLGAISSYLYDYMGDIDSIRRMAYFYCYHGQAIPFDIAYMGLLKMPDPRNWRHFSATVPSVEARAETEFNKSLPLWVTRATEEVKGEIAGYWPWLRQGWQFIEDPYPEEKAIGNNLQNVLQYLLPSQFTSFELKGAEILINKFSMEVIV